MSKKELPSTCCTSAAETCCRVESLVTVDERGQMVLPKDLRDRAGIKAGDKLAAVSWNAGGRVCCIALIRADELTDLVTHRLEPLLRNIRNSPGLR